MRHTTTFEKQNINANNDIFIFLTKSNKVAHAKTCSRIRYMRVVFEFWKCSHCPRNTICARERTPKQLQWSCIPDLHTTNIEIHAQKQIYQQQINKNNFLKQKKKTAINTKFLRGCFARAGSLLCFWFSILCFVLIIVFVCTSFADAEHRKLINIPQTNPNKSKTIEKTLKHFLKENDVHSAK